MAFATRADLIEVVGAYLQRSTLASRAPDFVRLCEARLNRLLRDPDQVVSATLSFINGSASLPADFGQMIAFGPQGTKLEQVTPVEFGTYFSQAGDPRVYTVSGSKISVLPAQGSASTPIVYYRSIVPLSADSSTNWLLQRAPDVYLYGSLLQAEFYGWNDERLGFIKAAYDEAIGELRSDGENRRWGAAPLAPKLGRT